MEVPDVTFRLPSLLPKALSAPAFIIGHGVLQKKRFFSYNLNLGFMRLFYRSESKRGDRPLPSRPDVSFLLPVSLVLLVPPASRLATDFQIGRKLLQIEISYCPLLAAVQRGFWERGIWRGILSHFFRRNQESQTKEQKMLFARLGQHSSAWNFLCLR